MRIAFSLFFFIIVFSINLNGQVLETKNWCLAKCDLVGDERYNTELLYLQMKNDSITKLVDMDYTDRVPIRIGIIQQDSIDVEIPEIIIRRAINNLNKSFAGTKLVFYLERTDVIISKLKLEDLSENRYKAYNDFSDKYDEPDLLSIYIFDHGNEFCNITPTSISCTKKGGFSYILSERTNNLVMSRFDISNLKVLAHEMGHFWGLYHTFEEAQYGKDEMIEKKCHLVGDRICDTPADPGPNYEVYVNYGSCEVLNLKNEAGVDYKPLVDNFMSYYKPCYMRRFSFTPEQITVIKMAAKLPMRSKFVRNKKKN